MHKRRLPSPANSDDPEQSRRFIDMAREVEVDESPGAMDRAFGRVVTAKEKNKGIGQQPPRGGKKR